MCFKIFLLFDCSSILSSLFGCFTLWHRHLVEPFLKIAQVCILLPFGCKLSASYRKFRYIIANINTPFFAVLTTDQCRQSTLVTCNQVMFSCSKSDRNATTPYCKWAKLPDARVYLEQVLSCGFTAIAFQSKTERAWDIEKW